MKTFTFCVLFSFGMSIWKSPSVSPAGPYFLDQPVESHTFETARNLMIVTATVDGNTGNFLFDTGSPDLTLHQKHFQIRKKVKTTGYSVDIGQRSVPLRLFRVKNFQWGSLSRKNFDVVLADLREIESALGIELMGLIGYQVFKNLEIWIDHDQKRITLIQLDRRGNRPDCIQPEQPDFSIDMQVQRHLPVVTAHLNHEKPLRLAIDSGASINIMDKKWKKQIKNQARQQGEVPIISFYPGFHQAEAFILDHLFIGKISLENWRVALTDFSFFRRNQIFLDGLIGIDLFRYRRVVFNFKRKKLFLWDFPLTEIEFSCD